jgi:hypothetical protein
MAKKSTSEYYKDNPDAAAQHRRYMRKYNKQPGKSQYRSELNQERRKRGIYGKGGGDLSHSRNGSLKIEDPSRNRARNGHGNNKRYA